MSDGNVEMWKFENVEIWECENPVRDDMFVAPLRTVF